MFAKGLDCFQCFQRISSYTADFGRTYSIYLIGLYEFHQFLDFGTFLVLLRSADLVCEHLDHFPTFGLTEFSEG